MKKRVFSILTALCLCLTLLPVAAFATEESSAAPAEEPQQEQQEEVNPEANPEQPEGQPEVNPAEQPAAENSVPAVLNGEGETVIKLTQSNISDYMSSGLTDGSYQLDGDVTVESDSLEVKGTVTLDLNGHTLLFKDPELYYPPEQGQVNAGIRVYNSDSSESAAKYALTLCDTSTAKTGTLNVWGESMAESGEGLFVGQNGELTMTGGTITDSSGTNPWGIGIGIIEGRVTMTGGKIENQTRCGVTLAGGTFEMSGDAVISNCGGNNSGGGIWIGGGTLTMTGGTISNCTAQQGGGVYVDDSSTFNMNGGSIANCTAVNGGNSVFVMSGTGGKFTMTDGTVDGSVTLHFTVAGSDVYMDGLGTATYPYQISTAAQLKLFRDIVNGTDVQTPNSGACAVLMNDIVLNDGTFAEDGSYTPGPSGKTAEEWTPIGRYTDDVNKTPYTGTFDGKHYAIKGLYVVNLPDLVVGLFGGLEGAAVRNLTVDGYVQGCHAVSGIAGDASANSTIENCRNNCRVVSEFVTGRSSSYLYVGGIVGFAEDTTIVGCVNTGVVEARGSYNNSRASKAAGIVCTLCGNVIVKNCYNTGEINVTSDKLREGTAGGIAGSELSARNTVSDCYNLGAVTVSYTGNNVEYIAKVGGIMGYIYFSGTTVSNCYSVGTLTSTTGTGTSYIGGVVGITKGTVANCYYLDSTAEKAVWPDGGTVDEATGPKTAAQLGNGTVLALLINSRADSEHPWNSQCQYLAAAGKTLPVFKGQGDAHEHNGNWTSNGNGTHSRHCTCNAVETVRCSGGTATCTERAVCDVCKAEYGAIAPDNHGGKLKHEEAKAATTREEGNIEYWHCEACNKYFSDANGAHEITQAETVIPKWHFSGSTSSYPITVPDRTENGSVTVSPKNASKGSTVTITVTPDSGYVLETISVTDKNGNDLKLTDKGNGKYTFTMPGGKVEVKVTFMEDNSVLNFFYDVPNDAYYYEAVKWAAENGITGGVGNSLFAPNQPCTRAQIVTFLWRAAGSPVVNYRMPFTDVDESAYYAEAVRWAASTGIVTGLTEMTFGTNDVCTRAQAATMIYRYAQAQGKGFTGAWMFLLPFTDVPEWAYESVAWCYMNGVTTGVSETAFAPRNDCTRAQIVTFLWRAFSK